MSFSLQYQETAVSEATPDPINPNSEAADRRRHLTYDELIAMFVAFTTLGSVLFWGLTRTGIDGLGSSRIWAPGTAMPEAARQGTLFDRSPEVAGLLGRDTEERDGLEPLPLTGATTAGPATPDTRQLLPSDRHQAHREGLGRLPAPDVRRMDERDAIIRRDLTENLPKQSAQPATVVPLPALEPTRQALIFQDVPEGYWAKPYIDELSARGLIEGFEGNTFKPDEPVNRAQLARLIEQAFPLSPEKAAIAFTDLTAAEWAKPSIEAVTRGGFMNGFPDKSFQPNLPVPRAQLLTALITGLNTQAAGDVNAAVTRYTDANQIPDWAVSKIAAATQAEIVVNYPNLTQLAPNQPATRAEVAAMIYQALVYQGRLEPIDSQYVVKP